MGDTPNTTATPPAASGVTKEELAQAIQGAIAAATKPLAEQVAALQGELKTVQEASKAAGVAPKTEDVVRAVNEQLAAQQAAVASSAARSAAITEKGKGILPKYLEKIGNDPAKFDAEIAEARAACQADLAAAGIKAAAVSSDAPGGSAKPADLGDTSKLSGAELIAMGVTASAANPKPAAAAEKQAETGKETADKK